MKNLIPLICLLNFLHSSCYGQGNYWVFGDGVGINFSTTVPTIDTTTVLSSHEASASIADQNGNLLFYVGCPGIYNADANKFEVWNSSDQLMQNGDSLIGNGSVTQGTTIIPFPNDTMKYYIFHVYPGSGLYYSIVDLNYNAGLGRVTSKNNSLPVSNIAEKMQAVKHGNGRDWWLLLHEASSNRFTEFLIDTTGIHGPNYQSIGAYLNLGSWGMYGQMKFSYNGDKLLLVAGSGIIDLFSFDRCTGVLSNRTAVSPAFNNSPADFFYYGCSFAKEGKLFYVSSYDSLFQFDLTAANIPNSKQLIYLNTNPYVVIGQHMLAPDSRIYIANMYGVTGFPNQDYDSVNMHLSIINNPDSNGLTCNYSPYSFYLGGRRCILGLPNITNYNLEAITDSLCGSLTSINEIKKNIFELNVFPNPSKNIFNLQLSCTAEKIKSVLVKDILGREVFYSGNYSGQINLTEQSPGIYIFEAVTNSNKIYTAKLVKE